MSFDDDGYYRSERFCAMRFDAILRETPKAWLVRLPIQDDLSSKEIWFPKSQCELIGKNGLRIPGWLVEEKDIEEYVDEE